MEIVKVKKKDKRKVNWKVLQDMETGQQLRKPEKE